MESGRAKGPWEGLPQGQAPKDRGRSAAIDANDRPLRFAVAGRALARGAHPVACVAKDEPKRLRPVCRQEGSHAVGNDHAQPTLSDNRRGRSVPERGGNVEEAPGRHRCLGFGAFLDDRPDDGGARR